MVVQGDGKGVGWMVRRAFVRFKRRSIREMVGVSSSLFMFADNYIYIFWESDVSKPAMSWK